MDNDWHPNPRPETREDIIERCLELCPELVPPNQRSDAKPSVEDIIPIIIEEGCGLRPARKGGIRLERDILKLDDKGTETIPIVYNYGWDFFN